MPDLLAIDPGPTESAWIEYDHGTIGRFGIVTNYALLQVVTDSHARRLAVEMIASMGMPVGAETFNTCVWIGRLQQRWQDTHLGPARLVLRREVKMHLCGTPAAADKNVRRALIDRYGPGDSVAIGRKATPGPLYGISSHVWQALGVAVTADETEPVR